MGVFCTILTLLCPYDSPVRFDGGFPATLLIHTRQKPQVPSSESLTKSFHLGATRLQTQHASVCRTEARIERELKYAIIAFSVRSSADEHAADTQCVECKRLGSIVPGKVFSVICSDATAAGIPDKDVPLYVGVEVLHGYADAGRLLTFQARKFASASFGRTAVPARLGRKRAACPRRPRPRSRPRSHRPWPRTPRSALPARTGRVSDRVHLQPISRQRPAVVDTDPRAAAEPGGFIGTRLIAMDR